MGAGYSGDDEVDADNDDGGFSERSPLVTPPLTVSTTPWNCCLAFHQCKEDQLDKCGPCTCHRAPEVPKRLPQLQSNRGHNLVEIFWSITGQSFTTVVWIHRSKELPSQWVICYSIFDFFIHSIWPPQIWPGLQGVKGAAVCPYSSASIVQTITPPPSPLWPPWIEQSDEANEAAWTSSQQKAFWKVMWRGTL